MFFYYNTKKYLRDLINSLLNDSVVEIKDFSYPPNENMGDLSLACFEIAKKLKKTPVELANFLVSNIKEDKIISSVKVIGPYVNFIFNKENLAKNIISEILIFKDKYGYKKDNKKRTMIEYSNANTHKEYHIGHLRNICYGDSIARLLRTSGNRVFSVSYINDFGIHTAKTLWWLLKSDKLKDLEKIDNKGYVLGQLYVEASKEIDKNEKYKEEVGEIMKKIESRKGEVFSLWKKTRKWSLDYFEAIYKELKIEFEDTFYENEFLEEGLDMVSDLYEKHVLIKSQGAIIANLEEYNLGVLPIIRTDGTSLYPVADIPLAIKKIKKYKLNESMYVVDVRQSLYLKQLFKLLDLIGYKQDFFHLTYDFVNLPSGMMSSRTGNVITYKELFSQVMNNFVRELKQRKIDWTIKKIETIARILTISVLKFEMLKVSANKVITFNINEALKFDGFTAVYLQYTNARINSLLRKSEIDEKNIKKGNCSFLLEDKEKDLILFLAKYPEILEKAANLKEPSEIAKYLFDLAKEFNDYYHQFPIITPEKDLKLARLCLVLAVREVLKAGFNVLGFEGVEEM